METITLTGRNSRLSLLQIETVKEKIEAAFPEIEVRVKPRSSRGDELQNIALQTVEGTDFFTEDIFQTLESGEADIAVHSLKDMSAQHFFGGNFFSVVDRDDVRDVAIFRRDVASKIKSGGNVVIGTCSPRREQMVIGFLQHALPQLHTDFSIESKIIRGNVDTRLKKLDGGEYDGIILAAAGLNRLLRSQEEAGAIFNLLQDKRLMVLPLFECVPAPCQGAIVAESLSQNKKAVAILEGINNPRLLKQCTNEKKVALQYGAGCDQKFGVSTIEYGDQEVTYAAGFDGEGKSFEDWHGLPPLDGAEKNIFTTSETGQEWFRYESANSETSIKEPVVFISNHKAVHGPLLATLDSKRVWTAGSKTWLKMAKKGIWVEGCADGLGLESLQKVWHTPILNIMPETVLILTNESAAVNWSGKGYNARGTYRISSNKILPTEKIQSSNIFFWMSINQYQAVRHLVKDDAIHVCGPGETAQLLQACGLNPVIFPTFKAFNQWRKIYTPSPFEG